MAETNPSVVKRLGDSFGNKEWDSSPGATIDIMHKLIRHKLIQTRYLSNVLLSTGEKTIVEANPYDSFWGAGCSATQAMSENNNWSGKNELGRILMWVREHLRMPLSEHKYQDSMVIL